MIIKVLYAVLVLSTLALMLAAGACYMRVRRHLAAKHDAEHETPHAVRGD